jgi:hypothetical protein
MQSNLKHLLLYVEIRELFEIRKLDGPLCIMWKYIRFSVGKILLMVLIVKEKFSLWGLVPKAE